MQLSEQQKSRQRDNVKIKCPVALCLWEGKTHDFWKHIEDYKTTWKGIMDSGFPRSESHERWANYFFREIWNNPDLPEKVKWTNIAVAYVNQIKSQSKMGQHKHKKLSPDGSDKIEMHDGRITMNGQEYTPEEFSKIMPDTAGAKESFKMVRDISGDLRITHEGKDYTVEEFRRIQREKLETMKK